MARLILPATFNGLKDTPSDYSGKTYAVITVNQSEDGIQYIEDFQIYSDLGEKVIKNLSENGGISFILNDSGSDREVIRFFSDGKVGIGTDSPSQKFEVFDADTVANMNIESAVSAAGVFITSYRETPSTHASFTGKGARGTKDAPAKLIAGDSIFRVLAQGYNGTDFGLAIAEIELIADDDLSVAEKGAILFKTKDGVSNEERLRITNDGIISTGGETLPDANPGGFTSYLKSTAPFAFTSKGDAINHGMTDQADTDTYMSLGKASGANGGVYLRGFSESPQAFYFTGFGNGEDTRISTSALATVVMQSRQRSGTGTAPLSANGNLMVVRNENLTTHIFKGNGDTEADGTFNSGAFDFAEYFESESGETIPTGTSVTLTTEGKIRPALSSEIPIGVISETACFVGNNGLDWRGKYLRNNYGGFIYDEIECALITKTKKIQASEMVQETRKKTTVELIDGRYVQKTIDVIIEVEKLKFEIVDLYDEAGKLISDSHKIPVMRDEIYEEEVILSEYEGVLPEDAVFYTKKVKVLNPDYDESLEYTSREERPEWNIVGLLGQIHIKKGQPTNPNWIKIKDTSDNVELWLVK